MGHQRVYTVSDTIARFKRLQGYNVVNPMGWDAFGLPAENAAVEKGVSPSAWTQQNIGKMKDQMNLMLADFDWDREVNTSAPDYYKWTQKIFTLLFEKGLAYRKAAEINWDPVDQTVLANEQVDADGKSWRSGAVVEKRFLEQWFIGITKYAEALNDDLKLLNQWPEKVKTMQRHWIGKSSGAEICFPCNLSSVDSITVFTSRPDTIFSVQFVALALDHPIVKNAAKSDQHLQRFIEECAEDDDAMTKKGYKLQDVSVSIPIDVHGNKSTNFDVPVYAAPYVLGSYGHGAVMGCPAHDERDFEFWRLHNPSVPVRPTIGPVKNADKFDFSKGCFTEKKGKVLDKTTAQDAGFDLGDFEGLSVSAAAKKVVEFLAANECGSKSTQLKIRDWLISRQRYWGAPIPIVHCDSCGPVAVPDKDLPVMLPEVTGETFGKGNPLSKLELFVNTECPSCGHPAKRETDTMDTFIDSSWYFFRYLDPKNTEKPFGHSAASKYMPMDLYVGGIEHAILHLLYSRFISKFLGDAGMWDGHKMHNEPIQKLITQGMVQGLTYKDPENGRFLKREELDFSGPGAPIIKATGAEPATSYEKMSKSKFNGVDPGECIARYGADAVRAYTIFSAPIPDEVQWNEDQILGTERWLKKVLNMKDDILAYSKQDSKVDATEYENVELGGEVHAKMALTEDELALYNSIRGYVARIRLSVDNETSFNTIISDYMKMTNAIQDAMKSGKPVLRDILLDSYTKLLTVMSPVTPAVAEECWQGVQKRLGQKQWRSIFEQRFPESQVIESKFVPHKIHINGKASVEIHADKDFTLLSQEEVLQHLRDNAQVNKHIGQSTVSKVIINAKKRLVIIQTCK